MHPGGGAICSGPEEYVSLQLLLIKEESSVNPGKGEGTRAGDKEGPECAKLEETTPADCDRKGVAALLAGAMPFQGVRHTKVRRHGLQLKMRTLDFKSATVGEE